MYGREKMENSKQVLHAKEQFIEGTDRIIKFIELI